MPSYLCAVRVRLAGTLAAVALAVLALGACGTLVPVSSRITPLPPNCFKARPVADLDSFSTPVALQPGASGLQFGDIRVGCGPAAGAAANVNVQFTVWLSTGSLVITTRGPNAPANSLQLSSSTTLQFWRLGVPGMRVGGTRRLLVPPALAFGAAGNSSAHVPPNATLVVDVELVSLG